MARMLKPGGLFVLTCAGIGRGEHGTSRTSPSSSLTALEQHEDYYRNLTRQDFERRIDLGIHFSDHQFFDNRYSKDLYFVGFKRAPVSNPALAERLIALGLAANQIKLKRPPNVIRALSAHGEWWVKWSFARLLGERRYHDIRHHVRPRTSPRVPPPTPPSK